MRVISDDYAEEIFAIIKRTKIDPSLTHLDCKMLPKLMLGDKKNSGGMISFILPIARDRYLERQFPLIEIGEFCANLSQGGGKSG